MLAWNPFVKESDMDNILQSAEVQGSKDNPLEAKICYREEGTILRYGEKGMGVYNYVILWIKNHLPQ